MIKFENVSLNVCSHNELWDILGTGRDTGVGRNGYYYNAYFCPKCKKVYYEDCHFKNDVIKLFYSKKATRYYLESRGK